MIQVRPCDLRLPPVNIAGGLCECELVRLLLLLMQQNLKKKKIMFKKYNRAFLFLTNKEDEVCIVLSWCSIITEWKRLHLEGV